MEKNILLNNFGVVIDKISNNSDCYIRKLLIGNTEKNILLYSCYSFLLIDYLCDICKLDEYDSFLSNSENEYLKVEENEQDVYQYFCNKRLNYFYVRNNLFIENLNEEEISFLSDKAYNYLYDDASKLFVEKTFKKIIENKSSASDNVFCGNLNSKFLVPKNTLVLGLRYVYNKNNLSYIYEEIGKLTDVLEHSFSNRLNVSTQIIKYDDSSIAFSNINSIKQNF